MHENFDYYQNCRHRERNMGLFIADRVSIYLCTLLALTQIMHRYSNAVLHDGDICRLVELIKGPELLFCGVPGPGIVHKCEFSITQPIKLI